MSVLIKGMTMPKAGNWKTIRIYYDGTCVEPNWQGDCKVMKGCEAVPIPDHGDLVDRDELMMKMWEASAYAPNHCSWVNARVVFAKDIEDVPVVIPAERSEE